MAEKNICTCILPVNDEVTKINKNIQFSFAEAGSYMLNVYIDAPNKSFSEDDLACFDVCHGCCDRRLNIKVKGE